MNRATSRLPHLLLASAFAFSLAAAPAVSAADPVAPRDSATGSAHGKRMYKPYTANVESMTAAPGAICAPTNAAPANVASDPEEGGQVARVAGATNVQPLTSDPEEGGQIARTTKPKPKPQISDINVMKTSDKASASLAPAAAAPAAGCGSTQP